MCTLCAILLSRHRCTIRPDKLPMFLEDFSEKILQTVVVCGDVQFCWSCKSCVSTAFCRVQGKYLNVVRECGLQVANPYARKLEFTLNKRAFGGPCVTHDVTKMDPLWTPYGPPVDLLWTPYGPRLRALYARLDAQRWSMRRTISPHESFSTCSWWRAFLLVIVTIRTSRGIPCTFIFCCRLSMTWWGG